MTRRRRRFCCPGLATHNFGSASRHRGDFKAGRSWRGYHPVKRDAVARALNETEGQRGGHGVGALNARLIAVAGLAWAFDR